VVRWIAVDGEQMWTERGGGFGGGPEALRKLVAGAQACVANGGRGGVRSEVFDEELRERGDAALVAHRGDEE
jgi:hypothetical protein